MLSFSIHSCNLAEALISLATQPKHPTVNRAWENSHCSAGFHRPLYPILLILTLKLDRKALGQLCSWNAALLVRLLTPMGSQERQWLSADPCLTQGSLSSLFSFMIVGRIHRVAEEGIVVRESQGDSPWGLISVSREREGLCPAAQ